MWVRQFVPDPQELASSSKCNEELPVPLFAWFKYVVEEVQMIPTDGSEQLKLRC